MGRLIFIALGFYLSAGIGTFIGLSFSLITERAYYVNSKGNRLTIKGYCILYAYAVLFWA